MGPMEPCCNAHMVPYRLLAGYLMCRLCYLSIVRLLQARSILNIMPVVRILRDKNPTTKKSVCLQLKTKVLRVFHLAYETIWRL